MLINNAFISNIAEYIDNRFVYKKFCTDLLDMLFYHFWENKLKFYQNLRNSKHLIVFIIRFDLILAKRLKFAH